MAADPTHEWWTLRWPSAGSPRCRDRSRPLALEATPGTLLLAPDLVLVERLNTAWKSLRLGAITTEQFQVLAHRAAEPFHLLGPATALLARAGHCAGSCSPCLRLPLCGSGRAGTGHVITADRRLCASWSSRGQASLPRSIWPASRAEPWLSRCWPWNTSAPVDGRQLGPSLISHSSSCPAAPWRPGSSC